VHDLGDRRPIRLTEALPQSIQPLALELARE